MKSFFALPTLIALMCADPTVPAIAQEEKIAPRVDISYFRFGDDLPHIQILVRKRIQRRYFPMEGVRIRAYFNGESAEDEMGSSTTNERGIGSIEIPTVLMEDWHSMDEFEFIATVDPTDSSEAVTETISIHKARIRLSTSQDRMITAVIERSEAGEWIPEEDVELKFFIKREFGRLPITEDPLTSDAEGSIEIEFTDTLPGDESGVLTMGGWLEDHAEFGNIIAFTSTTWGTPTVDDNSSFNKRTLWSTRDRTPLWLLIFPNLIIAGIWGIILFLIYQIIRIKRISKSA
jgi:hypothetical protein